MKRLGPHFWLGLAAALGALGVLMGAFGSHLPSSVMPLQVREIFKTAVRYHLWHALALLGCGILMQLYPHRGVLLRWSAVLFTAGIVLFSGSLYGLSLSDARWLGPLTPLGGLSWIAAWSLLAWSFWRRTD